MPPVSLEAAGHEGLGHSGTGGHTHGYSFGGAEAVVKVKDVPLSKLKRADVAVEISERFTSVREAFRHIDADKSGTISREELEMMCLKYNLSSNRIEKLIARIDTNNDGVISFNEFARGIENLVEHPLEAEEEDSVSDFTEEEEAQQATVESETESKDARANYRKTTLDRRGRCGGSSQSSFLGPSYTFEVFYSPRGTCSGTSFPQHITGYSGFIGKRNMSSIQ